MRSVHDWLHPGDYVRGMESVRDNWIWVVAVLGVLTAITTGGYLQHYGIGPLVRIRNFWLWFGIAVLFAASAGVAAFFSFVGG